VRQEVARLSLAMARKVAATSLTAADRKRLFKKVLGQLPKSLEGSA
jgi:F0F1-type ATP synthase membrane subunit b/b'